MKSYHRLVILMLVVLLTTVFSLMDAHATECQKNWYYQRNGKIVGNYYCKNMCTTEFADKDASGNPIPWCAITVTIIDGNPTYVSGGKKGIDWKECVNEVGSAETVSSGFSYDCALMKNGSVQCWNGGWGPAAQVLGLGALEAISACAGGKHGCAVMKDGSVNCWGDNKYGQLGNGTKNDSVLPGTVGLPQKTLSVSCGTHDTCAVLQDGSIRCWGANSFGPDSYGTLGDGTTKEDSVVPVLVKGLTQPAVSVSTDSEHSCAVLQDGSVMCWGDNSNGQLGDGNVAKQPTPSTAVSVKGLTQKALSVDVGSYFTCALIQDGSVACWGTGTAGVLGSNVSLVPLPVAVKGLNQKATSLSVGDYHSCVVLQDGSVACWGVNNGGELSQKYEVSNGGWTYNILPVVKTGLPQKAVSVSVSKLQICAVLQDSSVWCWGNGQTDPKMSIPAPVTFK